MSTEDAVTLHFGTPRTPGRDLESGNAEESEPLLGRMMSPVEEERKVLDCGGTDIVQFSAPVYYADEDEGVLKVDIIRLGSMENAVAVKYHTQDGTAKHEMQYEATSGQLVFEDGEHTKTIEIPILPDSDWTPTLEFQLRLSDQQNCELGLYLHRSRVKILNSDPFPSDTYAEEIQAGEESIEEIDDFGLFCEYCQMNFRSAGVQWKTVFILVMDQLNNIFIFGSLWVGIYMVDTVFAKPGAGNTLAFSRYHIAILLGLWFVLPVVILHLWESLKVEIDVKGPSQAFLQNSMLRTYLDYTQASRIRVTYAELLFAIDEAAGECARSYAAAMNCVACLGKIITVALFVFLYVRDRFTIYAILLVPTILLIFTMIRVEETVSTQKEAEHKRLAVVTLVSEASQKFRVLADYMRRPMMGDMFAKAVDDRTEGARATAAMELNTQFITKLLTGLVTFAYILLRTPDVLDGAVSLGAFLATLTIFGSHLAEAITELNVQLMHIVAALAPLREFTTFLNLPLELPALKESQGYRCEQTALKRKELFIDKTGGAFRSDSIEISMSNVWFNYPGEEPLFEGVNMSVPQGLMTAIVGQHNSGKHTFLSLLASVLQPTHGQVYVPSHLRVLNVSRESMFVQASLLDNLALGLPHNMVDLDRIESIIKAFGLADLIPLLRPESKKVVTYSSETPRMGSKEAEEPHGVARLAWARFLNHTRRTKLHIARALVANPEVICLDRTLEEFDVGNASLVTDLLRQHVADRGIMLPESGKKSRRPRSVFFSTESAVLAGKADLIYEIDSQSKTLVKTTKEALVKGSRSQAKFSRPDSCCAAGILRGPAAQK